MTSQTPNSNEWDPLKEVIVGHVANFHMRQLDKVFLYIYGYLRNFQHRTTTRKKYRISGKYVAERQKDLDDLAKLLQRRGIRVRRTRQIQTKKTVTPRFSSITNDCGCVRDMFLAIGNKIIETPPTDRRRYFEGLALKPIFMDYFKNGIQWIAAPKTALDDRQIDFRDWQKYRSTVIHKLKEIEPQFEIAFDGANCLRFGRDVVMNVGNKNHELGAYWLQSILERRYRVHMVRLTDSHIDGLFIPLEEGVLLVNDKAMRDRYHLLPRFLKGWKRIAVTDTYTEFNYPGNHLQLSSFRGMDTNVLPLGNKEVLIRDNAVQTIRTLEKEGFTPVPVRLRHCELFGGGPHCVTLDTLRIPVQN